ncbi:MAG: hypothetical protein J1F64_06505 [Oscillospiraceae bacterium]|nr:hypothetical protein [Oscillospiraceae bacterium]
MDYQSYLAAGNRYGVDENTYFGTYLNYTSDYDYAYAGEFTRVSLLHK